MSFSIRFEIVQDEDGTKRIVPGHNGYLPAVDPGAPVGKYTVGGHVAMSEEDWGESVSVSTPIGYASASSVSLHARRVNAEAEAARQAATNG